MSDTGGGNALNVQRTVKDLIAAGAAGCFLEVVFHFKKIVFVLYFKGSQIRESIKTKRKRKKKHLNYKFFTGPCS